MYNPRLWSVYIDTRQKAYNAREGIETLPTAEWTLPGTRSQKAYNAREGIETSGIQ